ncbi:MAG TPA: glycoside hydrolase family 97 catalytic domain-containing protein, partial [Acidobacteriaceae bacterium]
AELSLQSGSLTYRITVDGTEVLAPSQLGILSDGVELGQSVILGNPTRRSVNEQYPFFGAHSVAVNQANEATVPVTSHGKSYLVDVHVANDGVGVRMRLPAERGRRIQADRSTWMLKGDPTMWVDKLDPGYESPYRTTSLRQLGSEALGLPITAQVGKYYITITEAILKDFGDLGVRPSPNGALEGELFADPQGWTTDQPVIQPWRVTVIARDLTSLVNTTLVQNLNPPPNSELVGADWIKPGRSSWQWLAIGAPHQEDQEQWVDWTRQLGFQYYLIDEGWSSWKDAWASVASVVSYAKARNIKIWIWVDSKEVETADARRAYFQKVVDAGVAGVKIDFPPPTNHWWSTWYFDTARDAADFHLMLDFHGASKPTGMERTWPNVLTREAVRGHEYQITRYGRRLDAFHDVILPFTRYIAGPADYTPTVFNPKELQGNTWGHELAQAIIFTSPLLCFGGHPKAYLENPALDVIRAIPSVWDETRVLPGSQPGKLVAEARRSGNTWFIAVINGGEPLSLNLSLDFLGKGTWNATELFDANDKPDAWNRKIAKVAGSDHIALSLSPRGGFVARIRPE